MTTTTDPHLMMFQSQNHNRVVDSVNRAVEFNRQKVLRQQTEEARFEAEKERALRPEPIKVKKDNTYVTIGLIFVIIIAGVIILRG